MIRLPQRSTLFPYTTLFRSGISSSAATRSPSRRASATQSSIVTSRSEEHTSELQSRQYLVCRLLLEKKNYIEAAIGLQFVPTAEFQRAPSVTHVSRCTSIA